MELTILILRWFIAGIFAWAFSGLLFGKIFLIILPFVGWPFAPINNLDVEMPYNIPFCCLVGPILLIPIIVVLLFWPIYAFGWLMKKL